MIQGVKRYKKKRETEMIICNLAVSLLLLSLGISGTENVIRVPRNTVFRAPVMTELKINCTITTLEGCHGNPRVSWCKINGSHCKAFNYSHHIKTDLKSIKEHEWMYFLIFLNISVEDTGSYRCKGGDTSVSHTINVTVRDKNENEGNQSNTRDPNSGQKDLKWLWPYVYICSGIAGLVVIVMTVTLLIIRFKGTKSTRKDTTTKNQSKAHHNTPSTSDQLTSASYHGCVTPPVRGASSAGRVSDGSHNTAGTERGEEENALVYASLNHQAMSRVPRRTARQEPEHSEYVAIRFR
ncbi:B- and T-lymphocyte attenuator isoform X2 [Carassius gibelio]|uniref:B- and T-lymphocyte attenuator isoform X2 n=1 Tax=Carassius gibelio TaxID=101364 RepID=UPI002278E62C|nr:B- and T-lymphocyte attenuator isoform X2 [Carassius gibelio]